MVEQTCRENDRQQMVDVGVSLRITNGARYANNFISLATMFVPVTFLLWTSLRYF